MKRKPKKKEEPKRFLQGVSRRLGLPEFTRPGFADTTKMPDDILALEPANLTDLIARFSQLSAYVNFEKSKLESEIIRLYAELKSTKVTLFITRPQINQQEKWKRDSVVDSEPKICKVEKRIAELKSEVEVIRCYCENYDRYISALSRDLTRRKI